MKKRELRLKSSYLILYWVCLGILVATGIVGLMTRGMMAMNLGVSVIFLFIVIWFSNATLIRLHEDHLEMKMAPLAGRYKILYRDIERTEKVSAKKAVLHVKTAKGTVKRTIYLNMLETNESEELLKYLNSLVTK